MAPFAQLRKTAEEPLRDDAALGKLSKANESFAWLPAPERMTAYPEVMPRNKLSTTRARSPLLGDPPPTVTGFPFIQSRRANRNRAAAATPGGEPRGCAQSAPTLPKIPIHRQLCKCMNLRVQKICGSAAHKLVFVVRQLVFRWLGVL
jgi:hypothetical protein